jgi:hypothetical protein
MNCQRKRITLRYRLRLDGWMINIFIYARHNCMDNDVGILFKLNLFSSAHPAPVFSNDCHLKYNCVSQIQILTVYLSLCFYRNRKWEVIFLMMTVYIFIRHPKEQEDAVLEDCAVIHALGTSLPDYVLPVMGTRTTKTASRLGMMACG